MAKSTISALTISVVISVAGSANGWAQDAAPLAPRPFTPVGDTSSAYQDAANYQSPSYTTGASVESPSPSRFQLDGTEEGSFASKDTQVYNANRTRAESKTVTSAQNQGHQNFRSDVSMRSEPRTGYSLGLYGGVNAAQDVDGDVTVTGFGGTAVFDLQSDTGVGAAAGAKLRYTWPFDDEPIDQWRDEVGGEGLRISGALESEFGYVNGSIEGRAGGVTSDFDYDAFTFMVNAYLVLQTGNWRPYAGAGVGAAYLSFDGGAAGSDDTIGLAYQGILGVDYFIRHDWSLFAEYKYLVFDEVGDLYSSSDIDLIEQHLLLLGARKHF